MAAGDFLGGRRNGSALKDAGDTLAHRCDQRCAGNDRSRHQAEPLSGTNGLDLLDHEANPAWLSAAGREQEKPQQKLQCFMASVLGPHLAALRGGDIGAGLVVLTGNTNYMKY